MQLGLEAEQKWLPRSYVHLIPEEKVMMLSQISKLVQSINGAVRADPVEVGAAMQLIQVFGDFHHVLPSFDRAFIVTSFVKLIVNDYTPFMLASRIANFVARCG